MPKEKKTSKLRNKRRGLSYNKLAVISREIIIRPLTALYTAPPPPPTSKKCFIGLRSPASLSLSVVTGSDMLMPMAFAPLSIVSV